MSVGEKNATEISFAHFIWCYSNFGGEFVPKEILFSF